MIGCLIRKSRFFYITLAAIIGLSLCGPVGGARAQTADDIAKQYNKEELQQALETKRTFDLYGIRFELDKAAI